MNNDKVFMNPSFCREKTFDNGGRVINISIPNVAEFCDKFIEHANSDGSINIEIKEKRNVSDNGTTHYIQLSTYQPKVEPQTNEGQRVQRQTEPNGDMAQQFNESQDSHDGFGEDIPF